MMTKKLTSSLLLLLVLCLFQVPVTEATFSIAGTDRSTQQIGATGASCVPFSVYEALYQGVPGHGVLITQGTIPPEGSEVYSTGRALVAIDTDPTVILETITDPQVDTGMELMVYPTQDGLNYTLVNESGVHFRQYGVVDLMGRADAYTGDLIEPQYLVFGYTKDKYGNHTQEHKTGVLANGNGRYTYSAQHNIVINAVPTFIDAFGGGTECGDLVGRLFAALQAVFEAEEFVGDVRCRDKNISASSAFLHVDNADGSELFHADFTETALGEGVNPFPPLREAYETWRADNPCADSETGSATNAPTQDSSSTATPGAISGSWFWMVPSLLATMIYIRS